MAARRAIVAASVPAPLPSVASAIVRPGPARKRAASANGVVAPVAALAAAVATGTNGARRLRKDRER